MADIDNFKSINDTHGHPVGDLVLEKVARIVMDVIRHEDCAARYGGEEFIVLLPETSPENARYPAERIRRSVESYTFESGESHFSVTLSVGIAGYPDHAGAMDELVENADRALYQAKKSGKNMVRVFQPDE